MNVYADSNFSDCDTQSCELSIIIPIYNEYESIPLLIEQVTTVAQGIAIPYEIICIDDGSWDGSSELLSQLATTSPHVSAIILRRNYGQTAALAAGFNSAKGNAIVTLDGDLQNEPADIATVYYKLKEGYDLVSGWRKNRQDSRFTRIIPSKIANWLISKVTGVPLHDYGCSLKAYQAELIHDLHLYGELHRFLPALAFIEGARITEVPVIHHARQFGTSKYGIGRTFRIVMDLLTVFFMKKFLTRPMHIFGTFGSLSTLVGFGLFIHLSFLKLFLKQEIGDRPLLLLAVVLLVSGIQLFCFGVLAEMVMRTYHESQKRPIYRIRKVVRQNATHS